MASLTSLIDATYKEPSATVKFNGNRIRDVLSISVNQALEGAIGSSSIRTTRSPGISPEAKVSIKQGYDDKEQLTFTGFVDSIEQSEIDGYYTITCRDVLKKAMDTFLVQEVKFGQDIAAQQFYYSTYTSTDGGTFTIHQYSSIADLNTNHPETTGNYSSQGVKAEAVVQWLLHMSGLAEGSEIQVDTTNFWIGDINPAKFSMTSVYDAAMQIANLIGWRIYADANGVARFKRRPRQPGGYTYWKYADKGSLHNIHRLTKVSSNADLRNYVEVRGASGIRSVVRASSPYLGNTPYKGVLISEELIDTQGIADFFATRVLQDLNRLKVTLTMDCDGNPLLTPGSTLDVSSTSTTGKYLVEGLQTQMSADGGYKMTINGAAYLGDTKFDENTTVDIVASFVPTSVSVLGDPKYIVEFDGAGSYSDRGLITHYTWDWPDGSHFSSDTSSASYVFDYANISGGNSQNVTLHVIDALGNTAYVTSGVTVDSLTNGLSIKYRQLYGALTTLAAGSLDGGQLWTTNAILATSVAASNFGPGGVYVTSGHALFGTSDGKIYKTVDCCTNMTLVLTPGGTVTDVHIPELNSNMAAAVTDGGKVYTSFDAGVTWSLVHTFAFPLIQVKMGYTDFKYIEVVGSGAGHVYESFDSGANWSKVNTDLNVEWATDGASTNYFAHTTGVLAAPSTTMTFNGGSTPSVPAATVMIDSDSGVMIVDSAGQHWVASGTVFYQTQNNSANLTKHMIRDGEMEQVVYYATASGISKSIDRNTTIDFLYYPTGSMPSGGWGRKVAYGPLAGLLIPGQLVFRGELTTAVDGNAHHTNSWFISTPSGWMYGSADAIGSFAFPTIGGIALAPDLATSVDFLKCIPSTVGAGIGQLVLHSNWYTVGDRFRAIGFNRRSDSRRMLVGVIEATDGTVSAAALPDFVLGSGTAVIQFLDGPGFVRDIITQHTTSPLGESVLRLNYTFTSDPKYFSLIFKPDNTITSSVITDITYDYAGYQKSSGDYRGVVRLASDASIKYNQGLTGSVFTVVDLPTIPWSSVLNSSANLSAGFYPIEVFGSVVDQSRIYYATSSGIFSAASYGLGEIATLFNPRSVTASGTVQVLTVNPSGDGLRDYLCVIVGDVPTTSPYTTTHQVYYSTDSGEVFQRGPDLYDKGTNNEIYIIDLDI